MEMDMAVEEAVGLGELIGSLEQAILMAKQLPNPNAAASDPSQSLHLYSTLRQAHHHLSLFLSRHPHPPPIQPLLCPRLPPTEDSVFSAVDGGGDDVEPMQVGDDDDGGDGRGGVNEDGPDFKMGSVGNTIEGVEQRMMGCFIQNKRPKRLLSPSAPATEQRRNNDLEVAAKDGSFPEFDPQATRLRSLDLINQFHC